MVDSSGKNALHFKNMAVATLLRGKGGNEETL